MKTLVAALALSTLFVSLLFAQERDRRSDLKKQAQQKIEKVNWDRIKERIEGAVKRGDMTREQADQKYKELKRSLDAKSQGNRNQPNRARPGSSPQMPRQRRPDALGQLVTELVAQKKIDRDDARRIIETAFASRPPMQNQPNTHGQIASELRDILDQARNELTELQEAREEMHREHEEWEHHSDQHAEHDEREHHSDQHAERRELAEMMRKREADEREQKLVEIERSKLELIKRAEILNEKRRQLEKARREFEKEKENWAKRRESEEEN